MKYEEFKCRVMATAAAAGLTEYELYAQEAESISTEVLGQEINAFSTSLSYGACFRCISEGKIGYASTEDYSEEEAVRIVEAAMANAGALESGEDAFIHGAGDEYATLPPKQVTEPDAAKLQALALDIQKAAYESDERIIDGTQSVAAFSRRKTYLTNSLGLDLSSVGVYSSAMCMTVAGDGEEKYDGFWRDAGDFSTLDAAKIGKEACEDALSSFGADTIPTGKYAVVFSNKAFASILGTFASIFSAESAQKGLSLLKGKEGEMIAAPCVTLVDDPLNEECLVQTTFDSEGVATRRKLLIENGRLGTLLHNLATANKAGVASTGNGVKNGYAAPVRIMPYNFYLDKGGAGQKEDIFRAITNGLYVTELNGMHAGANPITGDFSLSSAGFMVENGEKGRPIKNFTISGNFYQLLKDIALVGDDLEFMPPRGTTSLGAPTIMVPDMAAAGK